MKQGAEQTASSSEDSATSFREMKHKIEDMMNNMDIVFDGSNNMNHSAKRGERSMGWFDFYYSIHLKQDFGPI